MGLPLRVLIVEDSEDDAMLLVRELRHGGYDPVYQRVDTQPAMIEALETQDWDIVAADYVMPQFSGLTALKLLQERDLDLPFIIVSGKISEDTAVEAMKAGAHDYIVKGNLARLNSAINRELREAVVRRERKKAEIELNEKRELLKLVIENIPQFIFWKDRNSAYLGCNKQSNGKSNHIGEITCAFPWKQTEEDIKHEHQVIETDRPELHVVKPVELHDGLEAWLDISRVPLHDTEGRVIGVLGVYEDITKRKQAEEEHRRRRERERRIHEEAESAKRQFFKETIFAVTGGKLSIVNYNVIDSLLAPSLLDIPITSSENLTLMRSEVGRLCDTIGMSEDAKDEFVTAVGEAAANAVKHAEGGLALIGETDGKVQVCIKDTGPGIDSLLLSKATLMTGFSTKPSMGIGFSLILAFTDSVHLATEKQGTWVLLERSSKGVEEEIDLGTFTGYL